MMNYAVKQMFQEPSFPIVEALFSESSNVNGDTVYAHAITNVNEVDGVISYAETESWTVADTLINNMINLKTWSFV